jgi:hypothetical protein
MYTFLLILLKMLERRKRTRSEAGGRVGVGEWESGRVGEWESGRVGEWESGRVGEWESGRVGEWESGRTRIRG